MPDQPLLREQDTRADVWHVHRWEHPDGRYFELASNALSAAEIERRGLPPAAKDYVFHSSTPMVPEADAAHLRAGLTALRDGDVFGYQSAEEMAAAILDGSWS